MLLVTDADSWGNARGAKESQGVPGSGGAEEALYSR